MRNTSPLLLLLVMSPLLGACGEPTRSWGELNSIIVATSDARWLRVQDMVESALEVPVVSVRSEKTFVVTQQNPALPAWERLQRFRQLLLIGTTDDPWMTDALALTERTAFDPPEVFQVEDIWSRPQTVTVMLLSTDDPAEVEPLLEPLHDLLDSQYREWVRARMFLSGRNEALADSLWNIARFSILLPQLYQRRQEDSVFMFRNANPDPSELLRQITVTWRPYSSEAISTDELLAWRQAVADRHFAYPQVHDLKLLRTRRLQQGDILMNEVRAVWANPPDDPYPAAGPFITRAVACPHQDRHYMVDAWLYAPGKDKYQYLLQLETILDSFRCSRPSALATASL